MKYKTRDELVADLRELADFLEKVGHKLPIEIWYAKSFGARFYDSDDIPPKQAMANVARILGKAKKEHGAYDFELVKNMTNGHVCLRYETQRENVCRKVVTGTEKVEKKAYVTIPGEFVEKEIVEWVCDEPLLADNTQST